MQKKNEKKITVAAPGNVLDSGVFFEKLIYSAYDPVVHFVFSKILVTRIGLCFSKIGYIRSSMYDNSYVFIRSFVISLMSLLKRGVVDYDNCDDKIAIVHTPWSAGYYHWITESIPRLMACIATGEKFRLLLPDKLKYEKYEDSIRILGVKEISYFPGDKNVRVNNLLMTDVPRAFGTTHPQILCKIREIYLRAVVGEVKQYNKRRIYVTRAHSRGRKVINEEAVIGVLSGYGFEIQEFENISIADQVKMMSESEILISIHGAALTNMIFMPAGGKILELVPQKRLILDFNIVRMSFKHDPCYIRLASAMGHQYFIQACTPINIKERTTHMADIMVDVEVLRKNIERMLTYPGRVD